MCPLHILYVPWFCQEFASNSVLTKFDFRRHLSTGCTISWSEFTFVTVKMIGLQLIWVCLGKSTSTMNLKCFGCISRFKYSIQGEDCGNCIIKNSRAWWARTLNTAVLRCVMMTSSNGNTFRVTGPLCGEFTAHKGQWRGALMFLWIKLISTWYVIISIVMYRSKLLIHSQIQRCRCWTLGTEK